MGKPKPQWSPVKDGGIEAHARAGSVDGFYAPYGLNLILSTKFKASSTGVASQRFRLRFENWVDSHNKEGEIETTKVSGEKFYRSFEAAMAAAEEMFDKFDERYAKKEASNG